MAIKSAIKSTLATLNIEVRRIKEPPDAHELVPEATTEDIELHKYIMDRGLTMVSPARLWTTILACRYVCENAIPGAFVECGVWRGGNALAAASIFSRYGSDREILLFDTFTGMTQPSEKDTNYVTGESASTEYNARLPEGGWCVASLDDVKASFDAAGLLSDRIRFIEGPVEVTLDDITLPREGISILRLDTDWYESTRLELTRLYPELSVGGVLILDDYGYWSGSRRATDEYLASHGVPAFLVPIEDSRAMVKIRA